MRGEGQFSSSCSPVPRSLLSDIRHFGGATSRRCLLARNGEPALLGSGAPHLPQSPLLRALVLEPAGKVTDTKAEKV